MTYRTTTDREATPIIVNRGGGKRWDSGEKGCRVLVTVSLLGFPFFFFFFFCLRSTPGRTAGQPREGGILVPQYL